MLVHVQYFAAARDAAGTSGNSVELAEDASVKDLRTTLSGLSSDFERLAESLLFAIDDEYVTDDTKLFSEADVACFPPVSGG